MEEKNFGLCNAFPVVEVRHGRTSRVKHIPNQAPAKPPVFDASVLPVDKVKAIQTEFVKLRKKHPTMTVQRALRKASEKYHVKITDNGQQ